jgi:hypothetical protein
MTQRLTPPRKKKASTEMKLKTDIQRTHVGNSKRKLNLYAVAQHTAPVSSNSPQKRIGFSPPQRRAFFCPRGVNKQMAQNL